MGSDTSLEKEGDRGLTSSDTYIYGNRVKHVIVNKGITYISGCAFSNFPNLETIDFASTVNSLSSSHSVLGECHPKWIRFRGSFPKSGNLGGDLHKNTVIYYPKGNSTWTEERLDYLTTSNLTMYSDAIWEMMDASGKVYHTLKSVKAKDATVLAKGNKAYWRCSVCKKYFSDSKGTKETTSSALILKKLTPTLTIKETTVNLQLKKTADLSKIISGLAKGDSVKSYRSTNNSVAAVSSKGIVTGKKTGTAKIEVKLVSGKTGTITVKVQKGTVSTKQLKITSKTNLTIQKGKTSKISCMRTPFNTTDKITYQSSNSKIATVSSTGVIKGIKRGKAKITVKSGSKSSVIVVTVK